MSDWIRLDEFRLRLPKQGGMRVEGRIYVDERLERELGKDEAAAQVRNVAHLPGIVGASLAMPDIHWGYGFPIGGVAAFDFDAGVVSPGGVGYDINCGVRLAVTALDRREIEAELPTLVDAFYAGIPAGVGRGGDVALGPKELKRVLRDGAAWAVRAGWGEADELAYLEDGGAIDDADPDTVSDKALERGKDQLGTLGSGNHFAEIGYVEEIFDAVAADAFGLRPGQITVLIHSGSRGLGYQVCDDFLAAMARHVRQHPLHLPDRQLACAPRASAPGREYLAAMAAAANYAFANRQILMARAARILSAALRLAPRELGLRTVYDVAHNIAKIETHEVEGVRRKLVVHRKGATRAFGPGSPDIPARYREVGQPVLVPGDMGSESYVLVGTEQAGRETFGSTCHGAGRLLSRHAAMKQARGRVIDEELRRSGVLVRARQRGTLAEEMPEAYKNVAAVVEVVHGAGLARKVARLRPLAVIKG
ncbi:MAG: RtcB family protein [Myxococcales bacterium]|nr:RtcB family protein [Myxococcales bacterium]